jgi:SAM-dependent methyltransferase
MNLEPRQIEQLQQFLTRLEGETYPEFPSQLHTDITAQLLDHFRSQFPLAPGARVLDVGCGQGPALDRFQSLGWRATGIALNSEDVAMCRAKGHEVLPMDQSFLDFPDSSFDLIWCRHCLEHSFAPFFTLCGFARVLRPQGYLYVEVPAPDTSCRHQTNANHYSVLGKSMWIELMKRAGFTILEILDINFRVAAGPDTYWAFILRRS